MLNAHLSIVSSRLLTSDKDSAIRSNCCPSLIGFGLVQHIILNSPAKENSRDPSVSSKLAPGINPRNPDFLAFFLASSSFFFSASSS